MAISDATDPEVWGKFFGALGPGGFVIVVIAIGAAMVFAIIGSFLLWWRGSEKFGFVGFGKEYQLNRIAQEKQAAALERNEVAQEEIKSILAKIAPFAEVVVQWLRASMQHAPVPPPAAQTNAARASSPSVQCGP